MNAADSETYMQATLCEHEGCNHILVNLITKMLLSCKNAQRIFLFLYILIKDQGLFRFHWHLCSSFLILRTNADALAEIQSLSQEEDQRGSHENGE